MINLKEVTQLPDMNVFGRVMQSAFNSQSYGEYTIYDAGFTIDEYLATPIAVINATLLYMKPFGGGVLTLPCVSITVKIGEEANPVGWTKPYYKVIIPAEAGLRYTIKGPGNEFPIGIDTSGLAGTENTGGWNLIEVGDPVTGVSIWSYVSLAAGITDPGAYNYNKDKMLDFVFVSDLYIKGDEPDAALGLTAFTTYNYQIGGVAIGCAKLAVAYNVHVDNVLNSGLVCGFYENAYLKDCEAANIGHRKSTGQPANFIDLIGLGSAYYADHGVRSVAIVENCIGDRIHDVAYMGIWTDVHLVKSRCKKTSIAVEHQAEWAATDEVNLGGNWYIDDCSFNCDTYDWAAGTSSLRYGDAIIANGGNQKNMMIRNSVIERPANMAVAAYMRNPGGRVTLDNVTIIDSGWAGHTEFPTLLVSKGDMYVNGGRFLNIKKDLLQAISSGNIYWGDRTDLSGCTRNLIFSSSADSTIQAKVNILDSSGYCRIGSNGLHSYGYDLDIRFEAFSGTEYLKLETWDGKPVGVSGKFKMDMNYSCPNLRPIVSYQADTFGVINLDLVNFNYSNVIVENNWNCSYGFISNSSLLYVNDFNPAKGAAVGVDLRKLKSTAGSGTTNISTLLSNMRTAYLSKYGLNLSQASCMGAAPSYLPYSTANMLQVAANKVSSCFPSTGWTMVFKVDSFSFLSSDDNKTRVRTLMLALENGASTGSSGISVTHWDVQGRDEFYVSIGGVNAYIDQDPTEDEITVALSYDGATTAVLSVNGKAKMFTVGTLPDFTLSTARAYIGIGSTGFSSMAEWFDPRSGNCNLQKIAFIPKAFDRPMLERLTTLR
jgi:hypothetical protein